MAVDTRSTGANSGRAFSSQRQPNVHDTPAAPPSIGLKPLGWLEARALFVTCVAAVVVLQLAGIPAHLAQDGYLALVAGRIIEAHGIPHHDYLTVIDRKSVV